MKITYFPSRSHSKTYEIGIAYSPGFLIIRLLKHAWRIEL